MNSSRCVHLFLATALASLPGWAASAHIGIASAISSYSVNGSNVTGSSDIADGTALRTTTSPSDVRLASGAKLLLATRSAGTVYNDHVSLNEGALRVSNFGEYPVATRSLEIRAGSPGAEAVVRMNGKRVEVASLGGTVNVSDGGVILTRVAAGTRMAFDDQTSTAPQDQAKQKQNPKDQGQETTQTGASGPSHPPTSDADRNALLWSIVGIAGAAVVIGSIAAAQGKSP